MISQHWLRSEKITQLCQHLMASWSPLFGKAAAEIVLYQFDPEIFQPYLEQVGIRLPVLGCDRKTVVSGTLQLLHGILEAPYCNSVSYISPFRNVL